MKNKPSKPARKKPGKKQGKVILVGAGPGDPGLITVRGLQALKRAHVILYDLLVSPELQEIFPPGAEAIFVGKEAGTHYVDQSQTNELLVSKAKQGKTVVRLKGGDPFTFGRGGEEAEACVKAGVAFEVVPGITSGIAAPAYAGIPVTHRDSSSSLAFITGHRRADGTVRTIPAPRVDTLVYYMGVRTLPQIVAALRKERWPKSTPIAVIHRGTTPRQQVVSGTLASIVNKANRAKIRHPSIIIVGKVAAYRKQLNWFEQLPLLGRKIFIAQEIPEARDLKDRLYGLGAEVHCMPGPSIKTLKATPELDSAIKRLKTYHALLFAHPLAVEVFFNRLLHAGRDARSLGNLITAAQGQATRSALDKRSISCDLILPADELTPLPQKTVSIIKNKKMLLPDAWPGPQSLIQALKKTGAKVKLIPAYDLKSGPTLNKLPLDIELVVFPTHASVENLMTQVILPIYVDLAAIGPGPIAALKSHRQTPALSIKKTSPDAAVQAIIDWATGMMPVQR
jgi:uroporphyrinogen III methyltransferase/synthase